MKFDFPGFRDLGFIRLIFPGRFHYKYDSLSCHYGKLIPETNLLFCVKRA